MIWQAFQVLFSCFLGIVLAVFIHLGVVATMNITDSSLGKLFISLRNKFSSEVILVALFLPVIFSWFYILVYGLTTKGNKEHVLPYIVCLVVYLAVVVTRSILSSLIKRLFHVRLTSSSN